MEPWYKTTIPRKELREGRSLDPSEFAVHLEEIVSGSAPEEYRSPEEFFKRNYFGAALVDHCGLILRRLCGVTSGTAPVLSLLTQFGGGKTHTLATLYHLVNSGPKAQSYEGVAETLAHIGLAEVPHGRVAVFEGKAWDSRPGCETPWIDMAIQLAGDAGRRLLGENASTIPPGTAKLKELFRLTGQPVLILFDETLNFIARYPHQAEQFHAFMQNLTSALTATERAVGVFSLPASPTEMTDNLIDWQTRLTKVVGRVGKPLIAADPAEISEIVRRRLFEEIGKESIRQSVAKQYARWIFERRERFPAEFADFPEETLRRQFESCYPFHPSTLTVFQRKWQSLPTFQQTRGVLATLGLWISRAYATGFKTAHREPLITLGSSPLGDREFRSKILEQLGESRLEAAIEWDIAGENAHAIALDRELMDGVGQRGLHRRVATALFLESCGGMTDKVAALPELRFSLGDAQTETTLIDSAVQTLAARCYYLRPVGTGSWRFGPSPTLRRVHANRKAGLDPADVDRSLRQLIEDEFRKNKELELLFFPRYGTDIPDRTVLTAVVLDPDIPFNDNLQEQLKEWARNYGQSPRQYPGGLFWMVPESEQDLRSAIADWLAWRSVARDIADGSLGELDPQEANRPAIEVKTGQSIIREKVWNLYHKLLYWDGKKQTLTAQEIGHMDVSEAKSLTGAILGRLRQASLVNREIGASYVDRNWPQALQEEGAWPLAGLRAAFFQGHLTRLENAEEAIKKMLLHAVEKGDLGFGVGRDITALDRVWYQESIDPAEIQLDNETFILRIARAQREKSRYTAQRDMSQSLKETQPSDQEKSTRPEDTSEPVDRSGQEEAESQTLAPSSMVLEWNSRIPKDKWNLLSLKVLTKLAQAQELAIEVSIQATVQDPQLKQQLNAALQDLGLDGEFIRKL